MKNENIEHRVRSFQSRISIAACVFIGILIGGAFFFFRRIMDPIRQLKSAADRIAKGDLGARVFLKNGDEIKALADSFNYMSDEINRHIAGLTKQGEELRSIISSMQSGLLVLDRNGKIVLCNESMEKTVQASDITGQFYWAVIKDTAVFELIQRIQITKTSESTEVNLYGRAYQCNAAYVMKNNEIIIVFHDITGIRNLGKMKRDFVSNVSHELRTPLTAIKGRAETLKGVKGIISITCR